MLRLDGDYSFEEALKLLIEGRCVGIKPEGNSNFLKLYKPKWMNDESEDYVLTWNGPEYNGYIRTSQFLDNWKLIIVDHRDLQSLDKTNI